MPDPSSERFWDDVLQPGWQRRGPAIVKNRVYNRYNMDISWQEAEDIFQDVLQRVIVKEGGNENFLRDTEEARKILFGYLRNIIREWFRTEVVRRHKPEHDDIADKEGVLAVPQDHAERILNTMWDKLTEEERVIFDLHYLDGATQARVGDLLGISLGTVNGRLQTIRAKYADIREQVAQEAA